MAATTISRSNIGTNDDGSGTTGTVINTAYVGLIYDNIDALFSSATGLTLNQAGGDAGILTFESSDVAHGMTAHTATSAYARFQKQSPTSGGLNITGLTETTVGVEIFGFATLADSTKTGASEAPVHVFSALKSGTGIAAVSANGNLMTISNAGAVQFIFDAEGDGHANSSWTTFDTHDDIALLTSLEGELAGKDALKAEFHDWMIYNREALAKTRLVTFNDDGQHFVCFTRMQMALCGAIRQLAGKLVAAEQRLAAIEG